ncbi:MAG: hypothetical protein IJN74_01560 [Clostridia bacterium]|nr:hypothetical protein [Clostridia bacterium]
MKTISIQLDTPMKWYLTAASVLLLLLTIFAPLLGVSFAALNVVYLTAWSFLHKEKRGEHFLGRMLVGIMLCNLFLVLYFACFGAGDSAETAAGYQETLQIGSLMKTNMAACLKAVASGIKATGASLLPTVFIAPLLDLFGGGFLAYVLLLFNLFLVPFLMIISLILRDIHPRLSPLVFLFAPFLAPVLGGSLDVTGLIYVALWIYAVFKQTLRKKGAKNAAVLGILSFLLVSLRWQYFYFVTGTLFSLLLSCIVRRLFDKTYNAKTLFISIGIVFGVFFCLTVLFLHPYIHFTNFGQEDTGAFIQNLQMIFAYYGAVPLLFSLLGILGLWRRHFRQFTLFLIFYLLITCLLFPGSANPGQQYLFAPALFLLAVVGVSSLPKLKKTARVALYAVCSVGLLCLYLPEAPAFLRILFSA